MSETEEGEEEQARVEEGTELTTFLGSLTRATFFFYIAMATFVVDF